MSSEAKVTRTLVINSPQELFKVIADFQIEKKELIPFKDNMDLFINGCECDAMVNWNNSLREYMSIDHMNIDDVKEKIGCSSIRFFLDEKFIFEK